MAEMSS